MGVFVNKERDMNIFKDYLNGSTVEDIAKKYKLSDWRTKQIVEKQPAILRRFMHESSMDSSSDRTPEQMLQNQAFWLKHISKLLQS